MREVREYSLLNQFPNHKWNDFPKKSNREHTFVEKLLFAAFLLRTSSSVRERGVSVL